MLIAMVMVPIVAMMQLNGLDTFSEVAAMKPTNMDLFRGTTLIVLFLYFRGDSGISVNLILLLGLCLLNLINYCQKLDA